MNAEFNWWLLIVGLVIGAAVVYLVLADASRRESEVAAEELPREATWIATVLRSEGLAIEPRTAERVLELHRLYLSAPPPDEVTDEVDEVDEAPTEADDEGRATDAGDGDEATDADDADRASARGDHSDVERH